MCGIVGYIGIKDSKEAVLNGLRKLEYRGYDSAGIAIYNKEKGLKIFKDKGRVAHLEEIIDKDYDGELCIGHTRWATHGKPNKTNAHPHISNNKRFVIVHNGVIDNYKDIKFDKLNGFNFYSDTDTEVIVNLVEYYSRKYSVESSIRITATKLEGSYSCLIIDKETPDRIYILKNKTPLLIGCGAEGNIIGSDLIPLIGYANKYTSLEDQTFGIVTKDSVSITDYLGNPLEYVVKKLSMSDQEISLGDYPHYMLKEIEEQPNVIRRLISKYFDGEDINVDDSLLKVFNRINKINFVASGTSMYASYMGKYYFEKLCRIPSEVLQSSELVYSSPLIKNTPLFIFLSQSGETADSIAVLKKVKEAGYPTLLITNNVNSTMAELAEFVLDIFAGPEISVASTKAYVAQVVTMSILAKAVSGHITKLKNHLQTLAQKTEEVLSRKVVIKGIADQLTDAKTVFYIGRGIDYWACLESSLKLKEISYIHTEAFSSGELKHGTIALIDDNVPVIAICTQEGTNGIVRSNLIETEARGAKTFVISMESLSQSSDAFVIPNVSHYLTPLLTVVVTQLIAYYTAVSRNLDVDKPRNLAKSVTVE